MARKKQEQSQQLPDDLTDYRRWLVESEQKSQESFDKTVLSLSSGALGVSFVFIKDVVGGMQNVQWLTLLLCSWLSWGLSSVAVLVSFYASQQALRHAIIQVDNDTIREQPVGGSFAKATAWLNGVSVVLFLVGVLLVIGFVGHNLFRSR
jgi:hypothetical protein